ncbi:uncharacterized protein LOC119434750 [Dermacentor silvarum]|uniref:uncharacterized protein LOC119434750 n=1 Tax=Dermacentor silvarum TaxID=543639 RepID=UPI00189AC33F|nr:uncharacterized protein LOC119434750 [Dermacentor silvarum]
MPINPGRNPTNPSRTAHPGRKNEKGGTKEAEGGAITPKREKKERRRNTEIKTGKKARRSPTPPRRQGETPVGPNARPNTPGSREGEETAALHHRSRDKQTNHSQYERATARPWPSGEGRPYPQSGENWGGPRGDTRCSTQQHPPGAPYTAHRGAGPRSACTPPSRDAAEQGTNGGRDHR